MAIFCGRITTALHFAATNFRRNAMGLLLDNGADVNAKDNLSNNPLYHASRTSTLFVVEPLVTHEVNVRAENNDGMTVQDLASKFAKEFDSSEFIKVADFFEKIALKK